MTVDTHHRSPRLRAFRRVASDRRLRRAMLALLGFSIAEYATWVAILVYAYQVGGVTLVGLAAAVQLIPAAVLAPVLSTIPDRIPRLRALALGYASQAVAAGLTGWAMLTGARPVMTFTLAALTASLITATRPAHNSLIPELARDPGQVTAANVVSTIVEGLGSFLGPAAAGLIMGARSPGATFVAMSVLLGLAGLSVATLGGSRRSIVLGGGTEKSTTGVLAGFEHLAKDRSSRLVVGLGGGSQVVSGALDVLVVVLAVEYLGAGEEGAGYLFALLGAGGIIGGLGAATLVGRRRLTGPLLTGVLGRGLPLVVVGVVPKAAAVVVVSGIGNSVADVAGRTLLQRLVPPAVLGRLFGVLEGLANAGLAVGSIAAPALVSVFGVRGAYIVVGGLVPLVALARIRSLRLTDEKTRVASAEIEVLKRVEAFAPLDPPVLEALAIGSTFEEFPAGTIIANEGESGDRMWVIDSGRVEVGRQGRLVTQLGPGEYFGEIALLSNLPRIATVTARQPVRLLAVSRESFLTAMTGMPRTVIDSLAEERVRETFEEE